MSYFYLFMTKEEFKQRRQRIGMSQGQLADTLGLSTSTISKYEMGVNEIPKYFEFVFESLDFRHIKELQRPVEK